MIEVTVGEVDGVRFTKSIRILEPDATICGVGVHYIDSRVLIRNPEFEVFLRALGLRQVGFNLARDSYEYAEFPISFIRIKIAEFILRFYWLSIRWLYDNARMFKQIPPESQFSWDYFTPYVWYRKIRDRE